MHFFPSESIKMLESECTHHREKERERPLKGRSTYRMFWIQVNPMTLGPNNFCSTYLVKICTLLLIKYHNTYWLLGTPTSGKFTINEMQKWKFKILFDLEKTEIPIYYTEAKIHRKLLKGPKFFRTWGSFPKLHSFWYILSKHSWAESWTWNKHKDSIMWSLFLFFSFLFFWLKFR